MCGLLCLSKNDIGPGKPAQYFRDPGSAPTRNSALNTDPSFENSSAAFLLCTKTESETSTLSEIQFLKQNVSRLLLKKKGNQLKSFLFSDLNDSETFTIVEYPFKKFLQKKRDSRVNFGFLKSKFGRFKKFVFIFRNF